MSNKFKFNLPNPTPHLQFLKTGNMEEHRNKALFNQLNNDMQQYIDSKLNETNNTLKEQLAIAKAEAESAKKDARFSKIVSIVSVIIAIAAIIIPPLIF